MLAEAVATADRIDDLRQAMLRMQNLVIDKSVLAEELQHRVRNNLQLVASMLAAQRARTLDPDGQAGLLSIQSRVAALSKVYDQLLGIGLSRTINLREYARQLCEGLPELQIANTKPVSLTCDVASMVLDLDAVTALGLAVTKLVTNSYKHAFADRPGHIVVGGGPTDRPGWGKLTVGDDGSGYVKTERETKRHGVGLVARLMEQVSGRPDVHVDHGTTWTLTFPLLS